MHLNLKALGLALVAVFAMSAMAVSGASAQVGVLTAPEPITGVGEESGLNAFTGTAGTIECPGSTITGHKSMTNKETEEAGSHELLQSGESAVTLTPHFVNCVATDPSEAEHKITVTMNGCDVDVQGGETNGEGSYEATASLVCPPEKTVVMDIYPFKSSELGGVACTVVIPPQEGVISGELVSTEGHLEVSGSGSGMTSSQSGFGCETSESESDGMHINGTIAALNEMGEPVQVSVSH